MTKPRPFEYCQKEPKDHTLGGDVLHSFPSLALQRIRSVEDLLHERGVDVSHETVRYWWHRFGSMFAPEIRKRRIEGMKSTFGGGISMR